MFVRKIKNSDKLKDCIEKNQFLSTVNSELIQNGEALLAFRNNNATIYYKGHRLCNMPLNAIDESNILPAYSPTIFSNFLPVLRSASLKKSKKKPYFETQYIKATNGICDFTAVLPEILDNLEKDEDPESLSVSAFYKFSPMVNSNISDVILLDIEAEFAERNPNTNKTEANRIDVVLYNTKTKKLVFVEVKRLIDTRLYPKNGYEAEIMEQMRSYRTILRDQAVNIKKQYNKVIQYYNEITGEKIEKMDDTSEEAPLLGLLIVGCPKENESPEFHKLCNNLDKEGFKLHTHGDTSNIKPGTMDKIYKSFK